MKKLNKKNSKKILLGLGVLLLIIIITNIVKSSCGIIEEMNSQLGGGTPKNVNNGVGKASYSTKFNAVESPNFSAVDNENNKDTANQIKSESDKKFEYAKKYGKNVSIDKISNQGKGFIPDKIKTGNNTETNTQDGINRDSIKDKSKSVDNSKNLNDKSKQKNQLEIGFYINGADNLKINFDQPDKKVKNKK